MGRKDRARIRGWAEQLVAEHGADVAALVGVEPPLPRVTVDVLPGQGPPGQTSGLRIILSERWFLEHPDDAGCVIHELAHAYMRAPTYDDSTSWLIEGLADFVRDALGLEAAWTKAHFEVGQATAGYQTTADFLSWLDQLRPGSSRELSLQLMAGTYGPTSFRTITGRSLDEWVVSYEADRRSRGGPASL